MQCSIVCGIFKIFKTSFMTIKCRNCVHEQVRNVCLSTDFSQKQKRKKNFANWQQVVWVIWKVMSPSWIFLVRFFPSPVCCNAKRLAGEGYKSGPPFFLFLSFFFVCPFGHLKFDCFGPSIFTRVLKIDWHSIGN